MGGGFGETFPPLWPFFSIARFNGELVCRLLVHGTVPVDPMSKGCASTIQLSYHVWPWLTLATYAERYNRHWKFDVHGRNCFSFSLQLSALRADSQSAAELGGAQGGLSVVPKDDDVSDDADVDAIVDAPAGAADGG